MSPIENPLLVWGAGAIGGSVGAPIARSGRAVLFVDVDTQHVRALNEGGLRITGPVADYVVPVRATTPDAVEGHFPLCLLCVKSHHTLPALEQLAPHLAADGAVVSVQNGLCEHWIAERIGAARTVGAFVNFGADVLEPGVIHRGNRGATVVGEIDGRRTARIEAIHELFRLFEPDAVLTDNIFGYLWGKLAYASLLFATALTDDSIADVLAEPAWRPTLVALAGEAVAVADAEGIALAGFDGFDPNAFREDVDSEAAARSLDDLVRFNRASAKTHSGIWRDLAVRKRTTEVDAQLGWIVGLGERHRVPTPLTRAVLDQIHEIEAGTRPMRRENLLALAV